MGLLPGNLTTHPVLPSAVLNSAGLRSPSNSGRATAIALSRSICTCFTGCAGLSIEPTSLASKESDCPRQRIAKTTISVAAAKPNTRFECLLSFIIHLSGEILFLVADYSNRRGQRALWLEWGCKPDLQELI